MHTSSLTASTTMVDVRPTSLWARLAEALRGGPPRPLTIRLMFGPDRPGGEVVWQAASASVRVPRGTTHVEVEIEVETEMNGRPVTFGSEEVEWQS